MAPLSSSTTSIQDVADSTDWLATPLSDLMPVEASLRCQVCKDFLTTPMITSCSHTFCSLCIRRYLSQEGKCPACRLPDQEIKLRRNWVVEELVAGFVHARDGMLRFAKASATTASASSGNHEDEGDVESQRPNKRRKVVNDVGIESVNRRSTRSRSRQQLGALQLAFQQDGGDDEDNGSVYEDESEQQQQQQQQQVRRQQTQPQPEGMVICPSCSRHMKEALINSHLDRCLNGVTTLPPQLQPPVQIRSATSVAKPWSAARLPTINYGLLNESKLRSKLRDLGIPSTGSKELMCKRHTEWVNLWNANCDALQQLSKRDLLRQLDTWERTQGREIGHKEAGGTGVMVRDFDRKGYMQARKSEFDALIAEARARARAGAGLASSGAAGPTTTEAAQGPVEQVTNNDVQREERLQDQSSEQVDALPTTGPIIEATTTTTATSTHRNPTVIPGRP